MADPVEMRAAVARTQFKMQAIANEMGISRPYLSQIINGRMPINDDLARSFWAAMNTLANEEAAALRDRAAKDAEALVAFATAPEEAAR